ncbi:MAG: cell wall protein [Myxococcaceae bacterium]|nr:cell wall protein [Myxococcaceae bacterium]
MSVEEAFRSLIREEVESQLRPLQEAVDQLRSVSALLQQLSPLASLVGQIAGPAVTVTAVKRGPGRPRGSTRAATARVLPSGRGGRGSNARDCAIIDCKRPARTKGYCAAHYQKLRMLAKSNRLPPTWVDFAPPHSVPDLKLPRGRAASKALREAAGK